VLFTRIPSDLPIKLGKMAFITSILLLVVYQGAFLFTPSTAPFFEPDNYEYLISVQQVIARGTFNISNPYLVYKVAGYPEAPGLTQVPVFLHTLLPFLPIAFDFYIPYILAVALIYGLTLLFARRILTNTLLNQGYRYVAYSLILFSFLLLQQTEMIEWRGTVFVTAAGISILWIISTAFQERSWSISKRAGVCMLAIVPLALGRYMWNGWPVLLAVALVIPVFLIYSRWKSKIGWLLCLVAVLSAVILYVFPNQVEALLNIAPWTTQVRCGNNPLTIGEIQCLGIANGLLSVVMDLIFFAFAVQTFINSKIFASSRDKYEYLLVGSLVVSLVSLAIIPIYIRMLQFIAPYLALAFALGTVSLFARSGAGKLIISIMLAAIIISSVISFLTFWQTTMIIYILNNPVGLSHVASYLMQSHPNSTVFSFYVWGGYLEAFGHSQVYSDTVQELNYANSTIGNSFYANKPPLSCQVVKRMTPFVDYVVTSNTLIGFTLFANASNDSIAKNPLLAEQCNMTLVYSDNGFYLFKT
jgi:hypothetical protein